MASLTISALNDGAVDLAHISDFANSPNITATDRLGRSKRTLAGVSVAIDEMIGDVATSAEELLESLGYMPPDLYRAGIDMTIGVQQVEYAGVTYAPLLGALPFTTSGIFEADKFRVVQGVTRDQLAAAGGSTMLGHGNSTVAGELERIYARSLGLGPFNTVIDGDSINSPGEGGKVNWADIISTMSNFKGRGSIANVAVPGRTMAGTWAAFAANVLPKIQASVADGIPMLVILDFGSNDYGLRPAAEIFGPYDLYRTAVMNAGGIFMPMLPMRRYDWAGHEGTRLSLRAHVLEGGDPLTVPTDLIFSDPNSTITPGIINQTDDGIHPNAATYFSIAVTINGIVGAGYGAANINTPWMLQPFTEAEIPYINAQRQLTTDGTFKVLLSTNGARDLLTTATNSFPSAGKTGARYSIPGDGKSFEIATTGDTSEYSPQLIRSLVFFDLYANRPLLALSSHNQVSTMYGNWGIRRGDSTSDLETIASIVPYPAANNTPGRVGQFAHNPARTKIAVYAGDGTTHAWVVAAATTLV